MLIIRNILIVAVLLSGTFVQAQENWEPKADSLLNAAMQQLGTPYKWGTSNPNVSFDCSGFTSFAYDAVSVPSSRSSRAYATLGSEVPLEECRKGDCIVFAGTTPGSKTPGHVGIVVSNDEEGIKFIHCSSSKKHYGVVVTDYYSSNYPKRFLQVRRLIK